jgi:hypothetical protein
LTLTFAGDGGGDVNGGMTCSKGGSCPPVLFSENLKVTLMPTHDSNSIISGWSSECKVTGNNCEVTMDKAKTVTITFTLADKIRIWGKPYTSLTAAFAESTFGQIHARAIEFAESITVIQPADLKGGYDSEFNSSTGNYTILNGKLTIVTGGRLTVDGLIIRPPTP